MAVQESLCIQFKENRVNGPLYLYDRIIIKPHFHHGSLACIPRIKDQRDVTVVIAQDLKGNHRILSTTNRNDCSILKLKGKWLKQVSRFTFNLNKIFRFHRYPVQV